MTYASPEELRLRVTVDSDTPELLRRLAASKRLNREALHLMRLGLQMEMILGGKVSMAGMVTEGGAPVTTLATSPTVTTPVISVPGSADIPSGQRFSEMTGLDADYFSAPGTYQD